MAKLVLGTSLASATPALVAGGGSSAGIYDNKPANADFSLVRYQYDPGNAGEAFVYAAVLPSVGDAVYDMDGHPLPGICIYSDDSLIPYVGWLRIIEVNTEIEGYPKIKVSANGVSVPVEMESWGEA